jgi:hypothetical protein
VDILYFDQDFYVEPRWVVHLLLDVESFEGSVLDPCCGSGTIPSVCLERGISARGSDLVYRGFREVRDLFGITEPVDNIISNVPYKIAEPCARHMLKLARHKVALILPMTFWESRARHSFFGEYPPVRYWPCGRSTINAPRQDGGRPRPLGRGGSARKSWRDHAFWLVHL